MINMKCGKCARNTIDSTNMVRLKCGHHFCRECIREYRRNAFLNAKMGVCPICRKNSRKQNRRAALVRLIHPEFFGEAQNRWSSPSRVLQFDSESISSPPASFSQSMPRSSGNGNGLVSSEIVTSNIRNHLRGGTTITRGHRNGIVQSEIISSQNAISSASSFSSFANSHQNGTVNSGILMFGRASGSGDTGISSEPILAPHSNHSGIFNSQVLGSQNANGSASIFSQTTPFADSNRNGTINSGILAFQRASGSGDADSSSHLIPATLSNGGGLFNSLMFGSQHASVSTPIFSQTMPFAVTNRDGTVNLGIFTFQRASGSGDAGISSEPISAPHSNRSGIFNSQTIDSQNASASAPTFSHTTPFADSNRNGTINSGMPFADSNRNNKVNSGILTFQQASASDDASTSQLMPPTYSNPNDTMDEEIFSSDESGSDKVTGDSQSFAIAEQIPNVMEMFDFGGTASSSASSPMTVWNSNCIINSPVASRIMSVLRNNPSSVDPGPFASQPGLPRFPAIGTHSVETNDDQSIVRNVALGIISDQSRNNVGQGPLYADFFIGVRVCVRNRSSIGMSQYSYQQVRTRDGRPFEAMITSETRIRWMSGSSRDMANPQSEVYPPSPQLFNQQELCLNRESNDAVEPMDVDTDTDNTLTMNHGNFGFRWS